MPSAFSRALIAAAQGGKTPKLQKIVGELLEAGYKPTEADLFALKYFFNYETRGRPPQTFDPVQKLVRDIRDYCRVNPGVTQAQAFEQLKLFAKPLGYKPEHFQEKTLNELRRSTRRSKK
jgi:hypothetical protein